MKFIKSMFTRSPRPDPVLKYTYICDEAQYEIYLRQKNQLTAEDKRTLLTTRIQKLINTQKKIPSHFKTYRDMYDALLHFYTKELDNIKQESFKNHSTYHKKHMIHDIHKKLLRLNKEKLRDLIAFTSHTS